VEGGGGAKGWGLGRTEIGGNVSNGSAAVAVGAATRELKDAPPTNASNGKPAIKSAAIRVLDEPTESLFWCRAAGGAAARALLMKSSNDETAGLLPSEEKL
jgi:hypothetical protein